MPVSQNPIVVQVPATATNNAPYMLASGLNIASQPAQICASENQILYNFHSDVNNPGSNVYAKLTLVISTVPADGAVLRISAVTENSFPTYELTAAAEPKVNEYYSNTTVPARTTTECADSIAYALNSNYSFRQRFFAATSANYVVIQALDYGAKWNMNFQIDGSGVGVSSNNSSYDHYISQTLKDWALWADLYINSTGDLGSTLTRTNSIRIAQMENSYNQDNNYYFDVSQAIKNYITSTPPTLSALTMACLTENLVNFYLVYGEKYDEFNNNYRRQFLRGHTGINWALNSSLDFLTTNDLANYTFSNTGLSLSSFLTLKPNPKDVYLFSDEYLYFLYSNSGSQPSGLQFEFIVDVTYVDGTQDRSYTTLQTTSISATGGGLYSANVSPYLILGNLFEINNKTVKYYEVYLQSVDGSATTTLISTSQRYNLLLECESEGSTQFIFLNSLGGYDGFVFNGQNETAIKRTSTNFIRPISYIPTTQDRIQIIDTLDVNIKYTASSGYLRREMFLWLKDLCKSKDVYVKINNEYIPVIISNVESKATTGDDLYKIDIEYSFSQPENLIKQ